MPFVWSGGKEGAHGRGFFFRHGYPLFERKRQPQTGGKLSLQGFQCGTDLQKFRNQKPNNRDIQPLVPLLNEAGSGIFNGIDGATLEGVVRQLSDNEINALVLSHFLQPQAVKWLRGLRAKLARDDSNFYLALNARLCATGQQVDGEEKRVIQGFQARIESGKHEILLGVAENVVANCPQAFRPCLITAMETLRTKTSNPEDIIRVACVLELLKNPAMEELPSELILLLHQEMRKLTTEQRKRVLSTIQHYGNVALYEEAIFSHRLISYGERFFGQTSDHRTIHPVALFINDLALAGRESLREANLMEIIANLSREERRTLALDEALSLQGLELLRDWGTRLSFDDMRFIADVRLFAAAEEGQDEISEEDILLGLSERRERSEHGLLLQLIEYLVDREHQLGGKLGAFARETARAIANEYEKSNPELAVRAIVVSIRLEGAKHELLQALNGPFEQMVSGMFIERTIKRQSVRHPKRPLKPGEEARDFSRVRYALRLLPARAYDEFLRFSIIGSTKFTHAEEIFGELLEWESARVAVVPFSEREGLSEDEIARKVLLARPDAVLWHDGLDVLEQRVRGLHGQDRDAVLTNRALAERVRFEAEQAFRRRAESALDYAELAEAMFFQSPIMFLRNFGEEAFRGYFLALSNEDRAIIARRLLDRKKNIALLVWIGENLRDERSCPEKLAYFTELAILAPRNRRASANLQEQTTAKQRKELSTAQIGKLAELLGTSNVNVAEARAFIAESFDPETIDAAVKREKYRADRAELIKRMEIAEAEAARAEKEQHNAELVQERTMQLQAALIPFSMERALLVRAPLDVPQNVPGWRRMNQLQQDLENKIIKEQALAKDKVDMAARMVKIGKIIDTASTASVEEAKQLQAEKYTPSHKDTRTGPLRELEAKLDKWIKEKEAPIRPAVEAGRQEQGRRQGQRGAPATRPAAASARPAARPLRQADLVTKATTTDPFDEAFARLAQAPHDEAAWENLLVLARKLFGELQNRSKQFDLFSRRLSIAVPDLLPAEAGKLKAAVSSQRIEMMAEVYAQEANGEENIDVSLELYGSAKLLGSKAYEKKRSQLESIRGDIDSLRRHLSNLNFRRFLRDLARLEDELSADKFILLQQKVGPSLVRALLDSSPVGLFAEPKNLESLQDVIFSFVDRRFDSGCVEKLRAKKGTLAFGGSLVLEPVLGFEQSSRGIAQPGTKELLALYGQIEAKWISVFGADHPEHQMAAERLGLKDRQVLVEAFNYLGSHLAEKFRTRSVWLASLAEMISPEEETDPVFVYRLAYCIMNALYHEEALPYLKRHEALRPFSVSTITLSIIAHLALNDPSSAVAAGRRFFKRSKDSGDYFDEGTGEIGALHYFVGNAYRANGNEEQAIAQYQMAVDAGCSDIAPAQKLVEHYLDGFKKRTNTTGAEQALAAAQKHLELHPNDLNGQILLANCFLAIGRMAEAKEAAQKGFGALNAGKMSASNYFYALMRIRETLGEKAEALAAAKAYLSHGYSEKVLNGLIEGLIEAGDYAEALSYAGYAESIFPQNEAKHQKTQAFCLIKLGRVAEAQRLNIKLEEVAQKPFAFPDNFPTISRDELGLLLASLGNASNINELQAVLENVPENYRNDSMILFFGVWRHLYTKNYAEIIEKAPAVIAACEAAQDGYYAMRAQLVLATALGYEGKVVEAERIYQELFAKPKLEISMEFLVRTALFDLMQNRGEKEPLDSSLRILWPVARKFGGTLKHFTALVEIMQTAPEYQTDEIAEMIKHSLCFGKDGLLSALAAVLPASRKENASSAVKKLAQELQEKYYDAATEN